MSAKQPNQTDVEVGRRIRVLRQAKRYSQTRLAELIGVTFQQVQKYEKGRNRVSAGRLVQIAAALECAISDIVSESDAALASTNTAEGLAAAAQIDAIAKKEDRVVVLNSVKSICKAFRQSAATMAAVILVAPLVLAMAKTPTVEAQARADLAAKMREHVESGRSYPDTAPDGFPYASAEQLRSLSTKHQHRLPSGWRFDDEPAVRR